jgi:hypothetical protein
VEKRIDRWCNMGLSMGGILTSIESVIEETPIYWM